MRAVLGNKALRENGASPVIQITVNWIPDPTTPPDAVANGLLKGLVGSLGGNPIIAGRTDGEVCGAHVYRTDVTGLELDGTTMTATQLAAFMDAGGTTRWVAVANLLTPNPDNPGYIAQRDAMLKGFHLSGQ